ncbi:putative non-specific serine/threonine protein kinase [Helianthus annuus]|nr:putative non-specific serine/threonine protein kinase [Helianthus annuus]
MRSTNNIFFETENATTLGPPSYYVHEEKWAVSNGGIVIDRIQRDPSFVASTSIQVNNTRYPELYRTLRKSPGSLRYYGLGLENGPYTITLFFAETGNHRQKDFDISKEAGGIGIALEKNFDVIVTQSYLEIHLFWAGKGTCCIPEQGDYGPLISAIRVSAEFLGMGPKVKTYTYAELRSATTDFSSSNLLGEGGFGHVYKV